MNVSISVDAGAGELAGAGSSLLPEGGPASAARMPGAASARTIAAGPVTVSGAESFRTSWLRMLREGAHAARPDGVMTEDGDGQADEAGRVEQTGADASMKGAADLASIANSRATERRSLADGLNGRFADAVKGVQSPRMRDVAPNLKAARSWSEVAVTDATNEPANTKNLNGPGGAHGGRGANAGTEKAEAHGARATAPDASLNSAIPEMQIVATTIQLASVAQTSTAATGPDVAQTEGESSRVSHPAPRPHFAGDTAGPERTTERISAFAPAKERGAIAGRSEGHAERADEGQGPSSVESELELNPTGQASELLPGSMTGAGTGIGRNSEPMEHRVENIGHRVENVGAAAATMKTHAGGDKADVASGASAAVSAVPDAAIAGEARSSLSLNREEPDGKTRPATHVIGAGEVSLPASHVAVAQAGGAEASASVRDPVGMHGTAGVPGRHEADGNGSAAAGIEGSRTRETFAAADAGTGLGAPSWIHAGPRRAEAGFEDPALGWVGVRADLSGGSVHASLVPGTAEAAQVLGGHLKGLSDYLSEQHAPVTTLTMDDAGGGGVGGGAGQHLQQGAGQNAERSGSAETQGSVRGDSGETTIAAAERTASGDGTIEPLPYAGGSRGVHVSVVA